jgi:hypothetical protein
MKPIKVLGSLLFLLAVQSSLADLTLRHSMELKMAAMPGVPPEAAAAMRKAMESVLPKEMTMQVKGDKALVKSTLTQITDFNRDEITLLDAGSKRFATASLSQFTPKMEGLQAMPPESQKALEGMKIDAQTRKTGRAGLLNGIQSEEYEIVMSMTMPMPGASGQQAPATVVRMETQYWVAAAGEADRLPATKEFASYSAKMKSAMNCVDKMSKIFDQAPGMGEKLRPMMEEFMKMSDKLVVRMRMSMYMPMMADVARQLKKAGQPLPEGFDPKAPMMEMSQDLLELSSSTLPDELFQVPTDYQNAPMDDLMKRMMPDMTEFMKKSQAPAAAKQ